MANFKGLRGVIVLKTVADLESHSYGREIKPEESKKAPKVKEPEPEVEEAISDTESDDSDPELEVKKTRRRRS